MRKMEVLKEEEEESESLEFAIDDSAIGAMAIDPRTHETTPTSRYKYLPDISFISTSAIRAAMSWTSSSPGDEIPPEISDLDANVFRRTGEIASTPTEEFKNCPVRRSGRATKPVERYGPNTD